MSEYSRVFFCNQRFSDCFQENVVLGENALCFAVTLLQLQLYGRLAARIQTFGHRGKIGFPHQAGKSPVLLLRRLPHGCC